MRRQHDEVRVYRLRKGKQRIGRVAIDQYVLKLYFITLETFMQLREASRRLLSIADSLAAKDGIDRHKWRPDVDEIDLGVWCNHRHADLRRIQAEHAEICRHHDALWQRRHTALCSKDRRVSLLEQA